MSAATGFVKETYIKPQPSDSKAGDKKPSPQKIPLSAAAACIETIQKNGENSPARKMRAFKEQLALRTPYTAGLSITTTATQSASGAAPATGGSAGAPPQKLEATYAEQRSRDFEELGSPNKPPMPEATPTNILPADALEL
jgi:hypothetical protein